MLFPEASASELCALLGTSIDDEIARTLRVAHDTFAGASNA